MLALVGARKYADAMSNHELVQLARKAVGYVAKATDNAIIGRVPEESDVQPIDSPKVPPEIPETSPEDATERTPEDIIKDAIAVLQEGLKGKEETKDDLEDARDIHEEHEDEMEMDEPFDKGALDSAGRNEIQSAVKYMLKSDGDTAVSVKAIIKDPNGRTLVLRDSGTEYWDLPGGHVQGGEKFLQALKREISEETGLEIGKCTERETRMLDLGGTVRPVMFYDAEYIGGEPRMSEEHVGYQWAGNEDLNGLNLGVFKDILIPGPDTRGVLEVGDPASVRRSVGPTQIPNYTVKEGGDGGGIAGAGDMSVASDSHVDTYDGRPRREVKKIAGEPVAQLQDIIGTNQFMKGVSALQAIKSAIQHNVALIGTVEDEKKASLVSDIFKLYLADDNDDATAFNTKSLRKILEKDYGLRESDAKLIAEDQENKLMGSVMEKWQQAMGVKEYLWQTQQDDKVRPAHKKRQGRRYYWSRPPAGTGHPGQDINCRCKALPIVRRRTLTKGFGLMDLDLPIQKVSTGGGQFVTGDETDHIAPVEHKEDRTVGNEIAVDKERQASMLDSAMEIGGVKLQKAVIYERMAGTDMRVISKGDMSPFIIAGYASPVVVDQEGHKITHEALIKDLPRFMAEEGKYANLNILHSNLTVGKVLPEFTAEDGTTYKTHVDDIGLYAVAEIRTDDAAPDAVYDVIKDIRRGKLKSFSISGNAENPVFMCDERQCFYGIDKVNLFEITVCEEGVNQEAKFEVISGG